MGEFSAAFSVWKISKDGIRDALNGAAAKYEAKERDRTTEFPR